MANTGTGDAQTYGGPFIASPLAVAAWLDKGGDVDAHCAEQDGPTLLIAAAAGGHEATVRMLLQRGASVNLQDSFGCTPAPHRRWRAVHL